MKNTMLIILIFLVFLSGMFLLENSVKDKENNIEYKNCQSIDIGHAIGIEYPEQNSLYNKLIENKEVKEE